MIPVKHIDPDDLALYAMQLLPPDEMEEMSLHLQHSAEARRVLSEMYGDLSIFAHSAEMHSPPALARQRLMKHVAREKKAIPIDRFQQQQQPPADTYAPRAMAIVDEPVRRSPAAKVLPWLGWAAAIAISAVAGNFYSQREHLRTAVEADRAELAQAHSATENAGLAMDTFRDPSALHVALTSTGTVPPPEGRAAYVPDKGSLVFIASNLKPLQAYKTYELWIIPADGRDAIPAGTFRPDERGNASVVLPKIDKNIQAKAFGVTIEDGEGSSTPTMPIILSGAAS